jgi:arylsulfatase A-like enzyme
VHRGAQNNLTDEQFEPNFFPNYMTESKETVGGRLNVLRLALWFGLLTGIGEVILLAIRKYALDRFLFVSMDSVWMTPLANAMLFLAAGAVLLVIRPLLPRRLAASLPVMVFTALSAFTILLMYGPLSRLAILILALGLGIQLARVAHRHAAGFDRLVKRTLPVFVALVLVAGIGLRVWMATGERRSLGGASARPGVPNVLLIVLDTIRSWNLSVYGYPRPTTPEIERWMGDGTRFDHALSTTSWTLPSHATMFTGRWPHELSADWLTPLDRAHPTLAELLSSEGYASAGFVANTTYTSYESGLGRGFGHYQDYPVTTAQVMLSSGLGRYLAGSRFMRRKLLRVSAEDINGRFLGWLDERDQGRPFFVFLNYLDAHGPYQPPAPYDTLFSAPGSSVYIENLREDTPAREWSPVARQAAVDKYDESIAYLDAHLGRLFSELERRGLWDSTLVIITSDHGEEFGEREVFYHGNSLYRASLEVPLLFRLPGGVPQGSVSSAVSLRDLAATILDVSGSSHRGQLPGKSLARFWNGQRDSTETDTLLMELSYSPRLPKGTPIASGPMKSILIEDMRLISNGDGREELYDFLNDRKDSLDLAAVPARQDVVTSLRAALRGLFPNRRPARADSASSR